jgi:hypothetical protein
MEPMPGVNARDGRFGDTIQQDTHQCTNQAIQFATSPILVAPGALLWVPTTVRFQEMRP